MPHVIVENPLNKGGKVLDERKPAPPSRSEIHAMAKRRFQQPTPKRHGRNWRVLVWKDVFENGEWVRKRTPIVLGDASEIGFREAQKLAAKEVEPLNDQPRHPGATITFSKFVETVYSKIYLPLQSKSHADRYESVLKCHLLPAFGKLTLRELEKATNTAAQQYFISLKDEELGHASLKKIRNCFISVMAVAKKQEYIERNLAADIDLPRAKVGRKRRPHITPQQAGSILELIAEPYATAIFTAVCAGLIPSEIFALRWEDVIMIEQEGKKEYALVIDEKYCRGEWGAPKTEARNVTLPVSEQVIHRLHRLKSLSVKIGGGRGGFQTFKLVKRSGPGDLVFQSVRRGVVMRADNILVRHIKPAARKMGIPFVNWQCFRTSLATWLKDAGVAVRDAQSLMRHARASTTLDIYQQSGEQHHLTAVDKLERFASSMMIN